MITYSFAAFLRMEKLLFLRIFGVLLGCISIGLLVLPSSSLPDAKAVPWILLACLSAICWAMENIYLSKFALTKMGPLRIAVGMNFLAALMIFPIAFSYNQMFFLSFPFGVLEWTILLLSVISAIAYTIFIKVVNLAGPVFASQTGYLVTIGGVIWGILLFNESHSGWVWSSLMTILIALFLVTPRKPKNAN
jgi:drug/metabolite transporter (DMT)-like permease